MGTRISIVIISYNRPQDMLELVDNVLTLQHRELLAEVVIVNNHSTLSYDQVEARIKQNPSYPFRYYLAPENLGVSRGRNYAIEKSTGDILVFLDDDALFKETDSLQQIINIFEERKDRTTGIVSFKVLYHSTGEFQETAFAHKKFQERKDFPQFDTAYFVGCAHAIRKEVFDKTGYYPPEFFYGMEEYDLSYRTIQAGYGIVYDNRVTILHKEAPGGRLPQPEKLRGMWVNKTKVAWKYLPLKYYYSTGLLWSFEYLRKTGLDLKGFIKGWKMIWEIPKKVNRTPIDKEALTYLNNVQARLYY